MPYIDRDETGKITGIYEPKRHDGQEHLADDNQEVLAFLAPSYRELRRAEYPPICELHDAKVKQRHVDPAIQAEGVAQEDQYYADCLAVKVKYPKPA